MDTDFTTLLAKNNLSSTKPRLAVFSTLKKADTPLSIVDIAKQNPQIDKVSVYRTIDLFMRIGITEAVPHGWNQRYELAAPFKPHHHHLVCEHCHSVIEINSQQLERIVSHIAGSHEFEARNHTFEISGVCKQCRSIRQAA